MKLKAFSVLFVPKFLYGLVISKLRQSDHRLTRTIHTANIILAQSTLFTGLFFHCPSAVIITLFYYLREIHAKKCIISAIKLVKIAIFCYKYYTFLIHCKYIRCKKYTFFVRPDFPCTPAVFFTPENCMQISAVLFVNYSKKVYSLH